MNVIIKINFVILIINRHHGALGGMYGAYEHYVQPYPVTNP